MVELTAACRIASLFSRSCDLWHVLVTFQLCPGFLLAKLLCVSYWFYIHYIYKAAVSLSIFSTHNPGAAAAFQSQENIMVPEILLFTKNEWLTDSCGTSLSSVARTCIPAGLEGTLCTSSNLLLPWCAGAFSAVRE